MTAIVPVPAPTGHFCVITVGLKRFASDLVQDWGNDFGLEGALSCAITKVAHSGSMRVRTLPNLFFGDIEFFI